jgi:hypothetical protein
MRQGSGKANTVEANRSGRDPSHSTPIRRVPRDEQPRTRESEEMAEGMRQIDDPVRSLLPGNLIDSTATKEVPRLEHSGGTDTDLLQPELIHRPYKILGRGNHKDWGSTRREPRLGALQEGGCDLTMECESER